jgi:hypothetical protein
MIPNGHQAAVFKTAAVRLSSSLFLLRYFFFVVPPEAAACSVQVIPSRELGGGFPHLGPAIVQQWN